MGLQTKGAVDQRMAALALGDRVRLANARTLREIRGMSGPEGRDRVVEILLNGDEKSPIGGVPVRRLLVAPRGIGDSMVQKVLHRAKVFSGDRSLRQLTQRQRNTIALELTRCLRRSVAS
jgi:hypothetical protein